MGNENKTIKSGQFTGVSKSGDFNEARRMAIITAKEGLQSSIITYEVTKIHGTQGGFLEIDDLYVEIQALAPDKDSDAALEAASAVCGPKQYSNYDNGKIEQMIEMLGLEGYKVEGDNPWIIDVRKGGVKLQGTWREETSILEVEVVAKSPLVTCRYIWSKLDPILG